VTLGSRWQVTGGLRVERYGVDLESKTAAGEPQGPDGYERSDVTTGGKVGIVHKPSEYGSLYGAVSLSALPPASFLSNPDISRSGDNAFPGWSAGQNSATAKVQRLANYEVGAKWNLFDERLNVNAAGFRTIRSNIAMAGTVEGVANTFAGYGRQVVQGVELGAAGNITQAWSVVGGVLVMDSERQHSAAIDAARLAANPNDYLDRVTTNGDELAFTPNVTASLWTTYLLPFRMTIGGGFQHVGEAFVGRPDDAERIIPNGNAGVLPGYTVANAMAAYTVNSRLTLRFNVDNLTNEFYAVSSNWGAHRVSLGPARSFLLSTDVSF
jgi:catecholate siderophore receptor